MKRFLIQLDGAYIGCVWADKMELVDPAYKRVTFTLKGNVVGNLWLGNRITCEEEEPESVTRP